MKRRILLKVEIDIDTDEGFVSMGSPRHEEVFEYKLDESWKAIVLGRELLSEIINRKVAEDECGLTH